MRLRLTVWRHGLPHVSVLWSLNPPPATSPSYTISHLLEQINESIPLESGEWGLEDYAVEVQGFECLHYFDVWRLLKDDDHVHIRPLQTPDLRVRKISGRHQITEDGKHLIDGVPFGRPLLRKPNRPAIHIPPRKRRRLVYDEDTHDVTDGQANDEQLLIQSGIDNENDTDEDSDEDADFEPHDEDGLDDEIEGLQADSEGNGISAGSSNSRATSGRRTRSAASTRGLGLLPLVDENGNPFPGLYHNPLLDKYSSAPKEKGRSELNIRKRGQPEALQSSKASMKGNLQDSSASLDPDDRRGSSGSSKSVRFEDGDGGTPATVRLGNDSDDEDDENCDPDHVDESIGESDKENAPPGPGTATFPKDQLASPQTSSSDSSEFDPSDRDETSSSGTSSSDTSSDSEPDEIPSNNVQDATPFSDSTSSSDTTSESDFEPVGETQKSGKMSDSTSTTSSSDTDSDSEFETESKKADVSPNTSFDEIQSTEPSRKMQAPVPPGAGMSKTHKRNRRRKDTKTLKSLIARGELPSNASIRDLPSRSMTANNLDTEMESRRRSLLTFLTAGDAMAGVEQSPNQQASTLPEDTSFTLISDDLQPKPESRPRHESSESSRGIKEPQNAPIVQVPDSLENVEYQDPNNRQTKAPCEIKETETIAHATDKTNIEGSAGEVKPGLSPTHGPQAPRSRLDLASSRRLLFGSLGVRAPRNREEEVDVGAKLMKGVKAKPSSKDELQSEQANFKELDPEDESWKEVIELRAVECCYEGVELSTPPFPFVQRWDPQQRRGYGRAGSKRKAKKRKRNDTTYYENQYDDSFNDYADNKSPRRQDFEPAIEQPQYEDMGHEEPQTRNNLADSVSNAQAANDQLIRESLSSYDSPQAESKWPDLPRLPEDLSNCQTLTKQACEPGAIIAFKKLEMSVEDGWQPKISDHRVARVETMNGDGLIDLRWARRDWPRRRRHYNDETGERIYSRFEMPGYGDEDEDDDVSKEAVDFAEMIEPLLVQAADSGQKEEEAPKDRSHPISSDEVDAYERTPSNLHSEQPDNPNDTLAINHSPDETFHDDQGQRETTSTPSQPISLDIDKARVEASHTTERPLRATQLIREAVARAQGATGDVQAQAPSAQTRNDISEMFTDAGWRSSIGSDTKLPFDFPLQTLSPARNLDREESAVTNESPASPETSTLPARGNNDVPCSSATISAKSTATKRGRPLDSSSPQPQDENSTATELKTENVIDYPSLPPLEDESELFVNDRQHRSVSVDAVHSRSSPLIISPPSLRGRAKQISPSPVQVSKSQDKKVKQIVSFDGAGDSSSDEFPALFSQKFEDRLSQEIDDVKAESLDDSLSSPMLKSIPDIKSHKKAGVGSSQSSWKPDRKSHIQSDVDESFGSLRQSQVRQSSQIIDLTQSSDPIEPLETTLEDIDDSYKTPSSMLTGSGWIDKPKGKKRGKAGPDRRKSNV